VPISSPTNRLFTKVFNFQLVKRKTWIFEKVILKNMLENTGFRPIFWKISGFDRADFVTDKPPFYKSF